MTVEEKLKQVMADVFGVDPATVDENASRDTIPSWDSVNHVNLVVALEEKFELELNEEEIPELLNFKLIAMTLRNHLKS